MAENTVPGDIEAAMPATVPAAGPPGTPAGLGSPASDRGFDHSLRVLTVLVTVALVASVSLLLYRWIAPRLERAGATPIATRASQPQPAPKAANVDAPKGDEVLMDPRRVFRCEDQGQVSFSDQACGTGAPPAGVAARAAAAH